MNLTTKFVIARLLFVGLVIVTGLLSIVVSQNALESSIARESTLLTAAIIDEIDFTLHNRIIEVKRYAREDLVIQAVKESNKEFDTLKNPQAYIAQRDQQWANPLSQEQEQFINDITNNYLSTEMRERVEFYKEFSEQGIFSEIFITNKYGANIAQTGKTSDYYQADEDWWQNAKEDKIFVEDIEYDESAGTYGNAASIKIEDENGEFIGVIKAIINPQEAINILQIAEEEARINGEEIEFKLLTSTGNIIYATEKRFKPFEQVDKSVLLSPIDEKRGSFTTQEEGDDKEEIISYAVSKGDGEFRAFGWVLLNEKEKEAVLEPVKDLTTLLFIIAGLLGAITLGSAFALSNSFTKPILQLSKQATEIGKGNLDMKTNNRRNDEIGVLARTIDEMVVNLKKYQEKLLQSEKEHNKELEREVTIKTKELQKYVKDLENSKTAMLNIMQDLKESNEHLKELDKAKTNFLNIISHELKTPLTAIFAYLDIIGDAKNKFSKDQQQGFDAIRRNNNQLKSLINNILEMSRIEAGKFDLVHAEFNVKEKIDNVIQNLHILSANKGIELKADATTINTKITTDEQRFEEILNNLISNAIKFTEKGSVTIKASQKGTDLEVHVKDTGVGIPEEKVKNLFQKFYQVDSSISRKYGGTGLGLSITKQIIELQGGKIWVESAEGKGTTFSFTLPMKPIDTKKKGGVKK